MIKDSQEKYLATLPDGIKVRIYPFDPAVQRTAEKIISEIQKVLPDHTVHFGGAAALGLAGQNDIDLNILSTPNEYSELTPKVAELFGPPAKLGTSIKWELERNGFRVELYLTDKNSPNLKDQLRVFELLKNSADLRKEYEQIKIPLGETDFKEYMRRKYEFFNRILEEQAEHTPT